ncbi:MAG: aspartyl protease family protein [Planctomycetes bacterium]|nr:aspartyl protease family protein [Planctomycetota bacterium]
MRHVQVQIRVQNYVDWALAQENRRIKVRTVLIPDALVDTGTTYLCLPRRFIKELGLRAFPKTVAVTTAAGVVQRRLYGGALLSIDDRTDEFTVAELPDEAPALIGVIPLEALDYMVDPTTQRLLGKHGKKRVLLMC